MMNRFIFIAAIFLCISGIFAALHTHITLPLVSTLIIVLIALPAFYGMMRSWETPGIFTILLLGLFGISFEYMSVITGFPYSFFVYSDAIGTKLAGVVPWTLVFSWVPLVLAAGVISWKYRGRVVPFSLSVAGLLVLFDLALDPGATGMGYWLWKHPGVWYGVPWVNFLGWALSGFMAGILFHIILRDYEPDKRYTPYIVASAFLMMSFWLGVLLVFSYTLAYIPAALSLYVLSRHLVPQK